MFFDFCFFGDGVFRFFFREEGLVWGGGGGRVFIWYGRCEFRVDFLRRVVLGS